MDLGSSIAVSSVSLSIGGTIIGIITLFNNARKLTVDMLVLQVKNLQDQNVEFQKHIESCEQQLRDIRATNDWLTGRLMAEKK